MKKFFAAICAAALLISGCGGEEVKIGTIKYMNVSEDTLNKVYGHKSNPWHAPSKREYLFFDNMTTMLAALEAGQIAELSTYETVAEYICAENQNLEFKATEPELVDMFCCALRDNDDALKANFDAAITQMKMDGTFTYLVKEYISDINHAEAPPVVHFPTFYDADTIKIGVTGDLPRMDYVRSDGVPAGFNTAVLAEISKRVEKNFVLVQVDSGARAAALASGEVDVIFWAVVPDGNDLPADLDRPEGMNLTAPYFSDTIVHVRRKK